MIHSITLKNYKSFRSKTMIDLKPLTVFTGPNASGKSSILKAIAMFKQTLSHPTPYRLLSLNGPLVDMGSHKAMVSGRNEDQSCEIAFLLEERMATEYGPVPLWEVYDTQPSPIELSFDLRAESQDARLSSKDVKNGRWIIPAKQYKAFSDWVLTESRDEKLRQIFSKVEGRTVSSDDLREKIHALLARIGGPSVERNGFADLTISNYRLGLLGGFQLETLLGSDPPTEDQVPFDLWQGGVGALLDPDYEYDALGEVSREPLDALHSASKNDLNQHEVRILAAAAEALLMRFTAHAIEAIASKSFGRLISEIRDSSGWGESYFHLPAIRRTPQRYYSPEELRSWVNQGSSTGNEIGESRVEHVLSGVNEDLKLLGIRAEVVATRITHETASTSLYAVTVRDQLTGDVADLSDTGFGLSQLVPFLVALNRSGDLSAEQPELHLHPSPQAGLAAIIARRSSQRRQIILETHSEHLVRGLQVEVALGRIRPELIAIYYVDRNRAGQSNVKQMKIDKNGFFTDPWPEGFFDSGYRQVIEILTAARNEPDVGRPSGDGAPV
ncbi:DUF3696 domain-containing protein [Bacteroidota bacterium]